MTRTPDKIKKGLECCKPIWKNDHWKTCDRNCPYAAEGVYCRTMLNGDALTLIQQLQAENTEKDARIKQLEAERDAAVETIYEMAECITEGVCEWCDGVECERLCMTHATLRPGFKWRGVQKEE